MRSIDEFSVPVRVFLQARCGRRIDYEGHGDGCGDVDSDPAVGSAAFRSAARR